MNHHAGLVRNCIVASVLALLATAAPVLAATTEYLDFESTGSPSELPAKSLVKSSELKGTLVQISAFSFNVGKSGAVPKAAINIGSQSGGAGAGKVMAPPASLDVTVGPESEKKLFDLAAAGTAIPHVRLLIFKEAGESKIPTYTALLSHVQIVSANWTGKDDKPTAQVTLDCQSIEIEKNTAASVPANGPAAGIIAKWDHTAGVSDLTSGAIP